MINTCGPRGLFHNILLCTEKLRGMAVMMFSIMILVACSDTEGIILSPVEGFETLHVRYTDFEQSCDWNLLILNNKMIFNYDFTRQDSFLYSNIEAFDTDGTFQLGDEFIIEYEVLETNPYPTRIILCNRWHGIPTRVLSIK